MDKAAWYRLDNVGKFYSAQAGDPHQTVFRISAVMRHEVQPEALQRALERTVAELPSFNVVLRNGLFWRYLQEAPGVPAVQPEDQPVCFGLHAGLKSVLYRVSYFRDRINLEMSHMIADGRGALEFLKTLLAFYCEEEGAEGMESLVAEASSDGSMQPPTPDVILSGARSAESKDLSGRGDPSTTGLRPSAQDDNISSIQSDVAEDSFSRYFEKAKAGATPSTKPYRLTGWRDEANPTFFELHLSVAEVVAMSKAMGVSVTSLLAAAIVSAVRAGMPASALDRPITMDVPVDLRRFYGSETLRNFFGLAFVTCSPQLAAEPLEVIARNVQQQLADATIPANLARRMNQMVKLEKNPIVRWVPSFVKDAALAFGDWKARGEVTCTFSNLGRVTLPPAAAEEVRSIGCLTSSRGLNFLAVSCGDDLTAGISTVYLLHEVPCRFVRLLTERGLSVRLCVAKDAREVDADLAQSALEMRLRKTTPDVILSGARSAESKDLSSCGDPSTTGLRPSAQDDKGGTSVGSGRDDVEGQVNHEAL
ncbi:MAG: alcohol acetyltransferase [Eggerthellaceae bacterium]|nr:alcohol acetyltransferase [Eggerthellaceae bacterium]